jgi:hypothetical protein
MREANSMKKHDKNRFAKSKTPASRKQRVRRPGGDWAGGLAAHCAASAAFPVRLRTNIWGPLAPSTLAWGPPDRA